MDRYQRVERPRPESAINENEIRITTQGLIRNYISYASILLLEKQVKEIVLKAMGQAISKTVAIAEIIKKRIPGLYQDAAISSTSITDVWEPIEEGLVPLETTRYVSMISITLSSKDLNKNSPGYHAPVFLEQPKQQYGVHQPQQQPRQPQQQPQYQQQQQHQPRQAQNQVAEEESYGRGRGRGRGRGWGGRGGYGGYARGGYGGYRNNQGYNQGYDNNQGYDQGYGHNRGYNQGFGSNQGYQENGGYQNYGRGGGGGRGRGGWNYRGAGYERGGRGGGGRGYGRGRGRMGGRARGNLAE